ncbi:hypothetical protein [Sphingomonas sp. R86520]|uniref:hypothetical protein n=1 Tax=Sphingomonas sp. R86520 TaxID=3093859 RepID=UPI0036D2D720
MIITLAAALSYQAHINTRATLPEAYDAIRSAVTSERTIEAACKQTWCAIPTSVGKLVFQGAYVTAVWPRRTLVSAGPRAAPLPRVENVR